MDDEINIIDYWRVIRRRQKTITAIFVFAVLFALVYSLTQPKLYKATATIMPVDSGSGVLASALAAVPFLGGVGGAGGAGETKLLPILKSSVLATKVHSKLDDEYFLDNEMNSKLSPEQIKLGRIAHLQNSINVVSDAGLLLVSITWNDGQQAANIANLYINELGVFLNNHALTVNYLLLDEAQKPIARFKPKIQLNMVVGSALGLLLGILVAFFRELRDQLLKKNM